MKDMGVSEMDKVRKCRKRILVVKSTFHGILFFMKVTEADGEKRERRFEDGKERDCQE